MNDEENLKIARKWAERAGYISIYNGLIYRAVTIQGKEKLFPLNIEGLKSACLWFNKINQDIYRELPEFK